MKSLENVFNSLLILAFIIIVSGCTNPTISSTSTLEPLSQKVAGFEDIELPYDLTAESDKTMSVKNRAFQGGVYFYKGNVDVTSLKAFISSSMQNAMWQNDGESTIKKHSLMVYTKGTKTCIFIIDDELTTTRVTVVISSGTSDVTTATPFPPNN